MQAAERVPRRFRVSARIEGADHSWSGTRLREVMRPKFATRQRPDSAWQLWQGTTRGAQPVKTAADSRCGRGSTPFLAGASSSAFVFGGSACLELAQR